MTVVALLRTALIRQWSHGSLPPTHRGVTRSGGCALSSGADTYRTELCFYLSLGKGKTACLKPRVKIFKSFKAVVRHFLFPCPCFCPLLLLQTYFVKTDWSPWKSSRDINEWITGNSSVLKVSFCLLFYMRHLHTGSSLKVCMWKCTGERHL